MPPAVGMKLGREGTAERLLRLKPEEPEEGVVGVGETAVGRAPEDGVALRIDEAFVTRFAFVQPSVDRGHRLERSLEPLRHRVHFGRALLQRAGAAACFEKPCEQKRQAAERKGDQQKRRDRRIVRPGQNVGDGGCSERQRRQPEQHHAGACDGQAATPPKAAIRAGL